MNDRRSLKVRLGHEGNLGQVHLSGTGRDIVALPGAHARARVPLRGVTVIEGALAGVHRQAADIAQALAQHRGTLSLQIRHQCGEAQRAPGFGGSMNDVRGGLFHRNGDAVGVGGAAHLHRDGGRSLRHGVEIAPVHLDNIRFVAGPDNVPALQGFSVDFALQGEVVPYPQAVPGKRLLLVRVQQHALDRHRAAVLQSGITGGGNGGLAGGHGGHQAGVADGGHALVPAGPGHAGADPRGSHPGGELAGVVEGSLRGGELQRLRGHRHTLGLVGNDRHLAGGRLPHRRVLGRYRDGDNNGVVLLIGIRQLQRLHHRSQTAAVRRYAHLIPVLLHGPVGGIALRQCGGRAAVGHMKGGGKRGGLPNGQGQRLLAERHALQGDAALRLPRLRRQRGRNQRQQQRQGQHQGQQAASHGVIHPIFLLLRQ